MKNKTANIIGKACSKCKSFIPDQSVDFCPNCGDTQFSLTISTSKKEQMKIPVLSLIALLGFAMPSLAFSITSIFIVANEHIYGYVFCGIGVLLSIVGVILNSRNYSSARRWTFHYFSILTSMFAIVTTLMVLGIVIIFSIL